MKILPMVFLFGWLVLLQTSCIIGVSPPVKKVEGRSLEISKIKFEILGNSERGDCVHWLNVKLSNYSSKEEVFL